MRSTGVVSWGAVDWGGLLAKRQHLRAEQQHVVVVDHVALLERRLVPLREKHKRKSPTTPFFPYVANPVSPICQKSSVLGEDLSDTAVAAGARRVRRRRHRLVLQA